MIKVALPIIACLESIVFRGSEKMKDVKDLTENTE